MLKLDAFEDPETRRESTSSVEGKIMLPSAAATTNLTTVEANNNQHPSAMHHVEFESSVVDEQRSTSEERSYDDHDELLSPQKEPPPRMHVMVALSCTVGWIFVCAAIFKTWESEWSYAESCYFIFISFSTIGLGDVQVQRKDLMVLCFLFVIIGLSLVSMCINVIQVALEDLYR